MNASTDQLIKAMATAMALRDEWHKSAHANSEDQLTPETAETRAFFMLAAWQFNDLATQINAGLDPEETGLQRCYTVNRDGYDILVPRGQLTLAEREQIVVGLRDEAAQAKDEAQQVERAPLRVVDGGAQ